MSESPVAPPEFLAQGVVSLTALLRRMKVYDGGETAARITSAGEGNMNLTLRVASAGRTVIVKHARPWVEKYPQIAAPTERLARENDFYTLVNRLPQVRALMPRVLGYCDAARVLVLEDLAPATDMTDVYGGARLAAAELVSLGQYLRALHDGTAGADLGHLENLAMRRLNHEHIFHYPLLADNGLALEHFEPGLEAAARRLQADSPLCQIIHDLGERYLANGPALLHGDFFPGSWLRLAQGVAVIDVEFCFPGDPVFDLAVACAHLVLARQPQAVPTLLAAYQGDRPVDLGPTLPLYLAVEVMRRLIGVAQLPIAPTISWRAALLAGVQHTIHDPRLEYLCDSSLAGRS